MPAAEDQKKKKPKIEYHISENGNVIDASIDEKTHFISFRRQSEGRTKGAAGIGFSGIKGEAEKERKDEWTFVVWEEGELMPSTVWSEKRRKELLSDIRGTISVATGSTPENIRLTNQSGTVVSWAVGPMLPTQTLKKCKNCGAEIPSYSKFCLMCGKPQSFLRTNY